MIDFQPRYTSRLVRLSGQLERLEGALTHAFDTLKEDDPLFSRAILSGSSSLAQLSGGIDAHTGSLQSLVTAHSLPFDLSLTSLREVASIVLGTPASSPAWRRLGTNFALSGKISDGESCDTRDKDLFETVSPFQIESRLSEILAWTRHELQLGILPPILVISTFTLLFFQCSPFPGGNQQIALIAAWQLLRKHHFRSVTIQHPATALVSDRSRYASVLQQAERSALTNWTTVSAWSEFFVESVKLCASRAVNTLETRSDRERLTSVQRMIVEIVRVEGPVSRERIAHQTKINLSTVKYNLAVLAARGILLRRGGGRTTAYTVS